MYSLLLAISICTDCPAVCKKTHPARLLLCTALSVSSTQHTWFRKILNLKSGLILLHNSGWLWNAMRVWCHGDQAVFLGFSIHFLLCLHKHYNIGSSTDARRRCFLLLLFLDSGDCRGILIATV